MKLSLIVDRSGQVIAAMKVPDDVPADGVGAVIRPASPDHRLHEIALPSRLEATRIREIVRKVRTYDDGRAPVIPD